MTIQLSMIVVITSCAPTVALRRPAMAARPRRRHCRGHTEEDERHRREIDPQRQLCRNDDRRHCTREVLA